MMISASQGFINQSDHYDKDNAGTSKSKYTLIKYGELSYNHGNSKIKKYGSVFAMNDKGALIPFVYHTFSIRKPNNPFYFAKYLNLNIHNRYLKKVISSGARMDGLLNISLDDFFKMPINYPNLEEQNKINDFLEKLDTKINLINDKISILKKYKEGIEKFAYKYVENQGISIKYSDLFDNLIEKNNHKFQQYTIGKNGIKKIDEINYDISNHKIFKKFNVIVGIGIDEIGINKDLEYGSVSPVYDVYNIRNLKYFDSIYVTLKEQLRKKRNFITKKSTRREFEVDKYELKKTILKVVDNKDFTNVYQSITNIKKAIENLNVSFNNLKILKAYILRNMFI